MNWKTIILLTTAVIFVGGNAWACHKGGPMGFATNNPGAFSLDITISPTYTGASTSGTAGCKDWDYSQHQRNHYLKTQWAFLNEDVARGKGEHLTAFAQIMGCENERETQFAALLRYNYSSLFGNTEARSDLLTKFEILISANPELSCSG
jgi:hypothetical protein